MYFFIGSVWFVWRKGTPDSDCNALLSDVFVALMSTEKLCWFDNELFIMKVPYDACVG